jgi:hypothetical protein
MQATAAAARSSAAAVVAAPAAQPPPHAPGEQLQQPEVPHAATWSLLLAELWPDLQQQLVCRLLCVSKRMAALVHESCGGRLQLRVKAAAGRHVEGDAGLQLGLWFGKHAGLAAALHLDVDDGQQQWVAAGLRAAAGLPPCCRQCRTTRRALAATGAAARPPQAPRLHVIVCRQAGSGIAAALPACGALTRLELVYRDCGAWNVAGPHLQDAPAALGQLRALRVMAEKRASRATAPPRLSPMALCAQLTRLELVDVGEAEPSVAAWPASLRVLRYWASCRAGGWLCAVPGPITHLTALTRLECSHLGEDDELPDSLLELQTATCYVSGIRVLLGLTNLRRLYLSGTYGPAHDEFRTAYEVQRLVDCVLGLRHLRSLELSPRWRHTLRAGQGYLQALLDAGETAESA